MKVKGIVSEDFCNFKVPSLFISTAICDWKCCKECGLDISVCQNSGLASSPTHDVKDTNILELYMYNPITKAVVIGGLEPMLQFEEVLHLLDIFRKAQVDDPFVIYTGYRRDEVEDKLEHLRGKNVIVKFGRYIPNAKPRFDELLGVTLASNNQYAKQF